MAKFNLDIVYPPPYEREIWHYQKTNIDLIKRAINSFDWEKAFSNIDVDKTISIFNQTIINILCNFIPHEMVLLDDRDPPLVNKEIKESSVKFRSSGHFYIGSIEIQKNHYLETFFVHFELSTKRNHVNLC